MIGIRAFGGLPLPLIAEEEETKALHLLVVISVAAGVRMRLHFRSPLEGELSRAHLARVTEGERRSMPHSNVAPAKRLLARHLRSNATDAEKKTWFMIRDRRILGAKFRRQQPIGPYVVDFFCPEFGLVIEIDGSQHAERQAAYGRGRTQWLESMGYKVIRFWNNDVLLEPRSVAEAIYHALFDRGGARAPSVRPFGPDSSPSRGERR